MISQAQSRWNPQLLWLLLPSLLGSSIWWFVVSQTLHGHVAFTKADLPNLLTLIVFGFFSFGLWLGVAGIASYLTTQRLVRFILALIVGIPVLVFFQTSWLTLGSFALVVFAVWWGMERFGEDAHSRLTIKPHLSSGWAWPVIILLITAAVSLLYYQQLRGSEETAEALSRRLADQTVTVVERFIPLLTDQYRTDMTVDELIGLQIPTAAELLKDIRFETLNQDELQAKLREALEGIEGFDPSSLEIEPATSKEDLERQLDIQLATVRRDLSQQVRDQLSDQFQVKIEGDEPVHAVLTDIMNRQFERYIAPFVEFIPWLLAVALFFVLRIFSGIFLLFATWLAWAMVWLYRHLHIIHVAHETVPAEKIEWGK